jgi:hypothetical protein
MRLLRRRQGETIRVKRHRAVELHQRRLQRVLLGALAALLVPAVASAAGAVLTGSGLTATVTAAMKPSRLPKHGLAPTTLELSGTLSTPSDTPRPRLESMTLRLDRQLRLATTGLGRCSASALQSVTPTQARQRCGTALIGTGTVSWDAITEVPGAQPEPHRSLVLLFTTRAPKILLYAYTAHAFVGEPSASVLPGTASTRSLTLPLPLYATSFRFRIGRSWHSHGQRFSYLSGGCAHGRLSDRLALTLTSGATLSGALAAPCRAQ